MPREAHTKAAEAHENAAKSHRSAAEHHGKGEQDKGMEQSGKARDNSKSANDSSQAAHSKSESSRGQQFGEEVTGSPRRPASPISWEVGLRSLPRPPPGVPGPELDRHDHKLNGFCHAGVGGR